MNIYTSFQSEFLMRQGFRLFERSNYQLALEKFTQAYNLCAENAFSSLWMGFCLNELEKYAEAQEKYLEAISKVPDNVSLKAFLAISYMDQGLDDDALKILTPLVSLPKVSRPVSDSYGLCLLKLGKFEDAHKFLTSHTKHLGFSGISPRVFTALEMYLLENTDICYELDENIDAELTENLYLKVKANISDFFSNLAFWKISKREHHKILIQAEKLVDQKDYPKAKQLLDDLSRAKPDKKTVFLSAYQYVRMKDYPSAMRILDIIEDNMKTHRIRLLKALALFRLGDLKNAETLLNEISKEEDNVPEISYLRGLVYLKQGSIYKARKMFEKTLKAVNIVFGLDLTAIRLKEALRVCTLAGKNV